MAHEILSVKICELEDQLSRLSSRIHLSETAGHGRLQMEIHTLSNECAETELTMQKKLQTSRAEIVAILSGAYDEIEQTVKTTQSKLQARESGQDHLDMIAEDKILLAEYVLDFAVLAANRAILLSMEAIDAQLMQEERRTS